MTRCTISEALGGWAIRDAITGALLCVCRGEDLAALACKAFEEAAV